MSITTEYVDELIAKCTPVFIQSLQTIFHEESQQCKNKKYLLRDYQTRLEHISTWSTEVAENEYLRFEHMSKCDWLDKLIHVSIVSMADKIFPNSSVESMLSLPDKARFVHKCYIHIAREVWRKPIVMYTGAKSKDKIRYTQELKDFIRKSVIQTIRECIPYDKLIQDVLNRKTYSDPIIVENQDVNFIVEDLTRDSTESEEKLLITNPSSDHLSRNSSGALSERDIDDVLKIRHHQDEVNVVEEDAVKVIEDGVKVIEQEEVQEPEQDEVKVIEDEVKVIEQDEVKVIEDEVKVVEDEVKVIEENEVKVVEDEVKVIEENEVKVVEDEVKVIEDEVKVVEDEVKVIEENEVKVVEDEVKVIEEVEEEGVQEPEQEEMKVVEQDFDSDSEDVGEIEVDVKESVSGDLRVKLKTLLSQDTNGVELKRKNKKRLVREMLKNRSVLYVQ
jgi:hypothetical protein